MTWPILILIIFIIKIRFKKRKLFELLVPEEKFLLKEIYVNDGIISLSDLNNKFLKKLENQGIINSSIIIDKLTIDKKHMIKYDIKNWIKKEIEKNPNLLS